MKTSPITTSTKATQSWVDFKNNVLHTSDPKLELKIQQNWGKSLNFFSNLFFK